jgi:hypothetical protein
MTCANSASFRRANYAALTFEPPEGRLKITSGIGYRNNEQTTPVVLFISSDPPISDFLHSYRSATIGSTVAARRAGTKLATNATIASITETLAKVTVSVALTP